MAIDLPRPSQATRHDEFSLPEGQVSLEWPAELSTESVQDLCEWIDLVKRKMQRAVTEDV